MKLKINLVLFCAVLTLALGAHAQAATLSSSTPLPFCVADLAAPALPTFSPSPALQSSSLILPKCGACGSGCHGLKLGTLCGIGGGGVEEFCRNDAGTCTDGTLNCVCRTGPL